MRAIKKLLAGLVAAALLLATPAAATILFAGGEDVDFTFLGFTQLTTSGGQYRATYAREAIQMQGSAPSGDPAPWRALSPTFTSTSNLWFHAQSLGQNSGSTTSNYQVACFISPDGVCRLLIRGTGTTGQVKISTRDSGGSFTDLVTCTASTYPTGSLVQIDWQINYGSSGSTTLYAAGVQICTYSGNITTNSATQLNRFYLGQAGPIMSWSEVIVSDADTRNMSLFLCSPQANGTNMNWTGAYTNVNPNGINDGSPLLTSSSNQVAEFTCPSLPAGSFTIPAVIQSLRILGGAAGPANYRFIARPVGGGGDFDSGSDIAVPNVFTNQNFIWATNPATSGAWNTGALGSGVNFGFKSRP